LAAFSFNLRALFYKYELTMKLSDFDFTLPENLIAQVPCTERSGSRLMHLQGDASIAHKKFTDLPGLLKPNDLLVRNNVKVIKARLFGKKQSGGQLEFLVERVLDDRHMLSQIRASKAPKIADTVFVEGEGKSFAFEVLEKTDGFYLLVLRDVSTLPVSEIIEALGHLPLPPYIRRDDSDFDAQRYQTVYAQKPGAVAAPTAGLHFDQALFDKITALGVQIGEITLYVGSGTFQPVRVENINEHVMHSERFEVSEQLVEQIQQTRAKGGRVIAVGTTSLRALESACRDGELKACAGDTDIFIVPGYDFKCVDVLITNFHLPKSTLLMLVSAFVGREKILAAYQTAIEQGYRFFSYGDAMYLERNVSRKENL